MGGASLLPTPTRKFPTWSTGFYKGIIILETN